MRQLRTPEGHAQAVAATAMSMRRAPEEWRRRAKAIDDDLDIVWLEHEHKWAVIQRLYNTPSIEAMTDHVLRELRQSLREAGYEHDPPDLRAIAYTQVSKSQIVLRVENEDGSFRPLDDRTFATLRELAWKRRHFAAKDYIAAGDLVSYEAKRRRDAAIDNIWSSIKRDKVFARVATDVFSGIRPTRSVIVPEGVSA
jgi:aminopeptidase N